MVSEGVPLSDISQMRWIVSYLLAVHFVLVSAFYVFHLQI